MVVKLVRANCLSVFNFVFSVRAFLLLVLSLLPVQMLAWDGPDYTPEQYEEAMSDLQASSDMLQRYKTKQVVQIHLKRVVEVLGSLPYEETKQVVYDIFAEELAHIEELIADDTVLVRTWYLLPLLDLLGKVSHLGDLDEAEALLKRLGDICGYVYKADEKNAEYRKIVEAVAASLQTMAGQTHPRNSVYAAGGHANLSVSPWNEDRQLGAENYADETQHPNYPATLAAKQSDYRDAQSEGLDWIDTIRGRLEEKAFGQPELIDALLAWEYERVIFNSQRDKPAVIWAFGLPGTGKDTHLKAYISAIHGNIPSAYDDHVFTFPVCREKSDVWQVLGSSTGYKGSGKLSPLIQFMVKHSGGQYKVVTRKTLGGEIEQEVHLNEDWREGMVLPGYEAPDSGVLFVDEAHKWSKESKDLLLSHLLEKGYVSINTPGQGLAKISVPINIYMASNDLIHAVASRDRAGVRRGEAQSYEELLARHGRNKDNYDYLRKELLRGNVKLGSAVADFKAGISEDFLRRIPNRGLVLMRPTSPEALRAIIRYGLENNVVRKFEAAQKFLGDTKVEITDELVNFVAEFRYNAETAAADAEDQIVSLLQIPLLKAVKDGILKNEERAVEWKLSFENNDDESFNLRVRVVDQESGEELNSASLYVEASSVLRRPEPLSDDEIREILQLEEKLRSEVFGADHVAGSLQEAMLDLEDARNSDQKKGAKVFMFLGLSSTGKTELAKALARNHFGDESALTTIDFNNIKSEIEVRERIYGLPGGDLSKFAGEFDKKGGRGVYLMDEVANVRDPNVLTPLYPLMDEAVVDEFNDGQARKTGDSILILTGNAGEEIYDGIPRDLPENIQRAAAHEICSRLVANPLQKRALLERHFRKAFINRIGEGNIEFFCPLGYAEVRQLIQLKLKIALGKIANERGRRVYNVRFTDAEQMDKILSVVDENSFQIWEQGRSINHFVEQFTEKLQSLLKRNLVPSGEDVALSFNRIDRERMDGSDFSKIVLNVHVKGMDSPLELVIDGKKIPRHASHHLSEQLQTAIHEAAHSLVRESLLGGDTRGTKISIIPGVASIGGKPVVYLGIAGHEEIFRAQTTREYILSEMAVLIAGGESQRMLNLGNKGDAGHSNDLERANSYAIEMILSMHLHEEWGFTGRNSQETTSEYIQKLSDQDRKKLKSLVDDLMKEATEIAHDVLALHMEELIELGYQLARRGEMNAEDLETFYQEHPVQDYWALTPEEHKQRSDLYETIESETAEAHRGRNLVLAPSVKVPEDSQIANIDAIIQERKSKALEKVESMGEEFLLDPAQDAAFIEEIEAHKGPGACEAEFAG